MFRGRETGRRAGHRAGLYFATNNVAMLLRIPLLLALTSGLGVNYLVSNILSLLALTLVRFAPGRQLDLAGAADPRRPGRPGRRLELRRPRHRHRAQ